MSLEAACWAWSQRDIPATAKYVLLALAECVNGKGDGVTCWPSATHLTELTGLSRRTVFAALEALEWAGKVTRTPGRKGKATIYRLGLDGCTSCTSAADALGGCPRTGRTGTIASLTDRWELSARPGSQSIPAHSICHRVETTGEFGCPVSHPGHGDARPE